MRAIRIIAEDERKINFILQPMKTKTYWSTQRTDILRKLADEFELDVRPPSSGIKALGVPLGSERFVRDFFIGKFNDIDGAISLVITIADGRVAHNIHRAIASACRVTHLLRLISPADGGVVGRI